MTLRLTLICHGATAATRQSAFPADEPLEDPAAIPAAALKRMLRHVDRALVSPTLRTRQTAQALGLEAGEDDALRDLDYGHWAGRGLGALQEAEIALWLSDPDAAPHGGESLSDLMRRVAAWMDGLAGGSGHVAAVGHPAVVKAAVLHVLQAPARSFWLVDAAPLSLTDLRHDGRRWALRALNRTAEG